MTRIDTNCRHSSTLDAKVTIQANKRERAFLADVLAAGTAGYQPDADSMTNGERYQARMRGLRMMHRGYITIENGVHRLTVDGLIAMHRAGLLWSA